MPGEPKLDQPLTGGVSLRAAIHHFVEHCCFDACAITFHVDGCPVLWLVFAVNGFDLLFQLSKHFIHKSFWHVSKRVVPAEQLVEFFEELLGSRHESRQMFT